MSKKFVTIKINTQDSKNAESREALTRYGVQGTPTIVFASSDGGMISQQSGFISADKFVPVIENALAKEEAFFKKLASLKKTPDDAKLNAEVALTYLERRQFAKAERFSEKAFRQDPNNSTQLIPKLHNQLGIAYGRLVEQTMFENTEEGEMHFAKALSHFKTVIDTYPQSDVYEEAQYYLGAAYAAKGDFKASISVLEKLLHRATDETIKQNVEAMLERIKDSASK